MLRIRFTLLRLALVSAALASAALAPACGGGGGGAGDTGGNGGGGGGGDDEGIDPGKVPDLGPSTFTVAPAFGTPADGQASVTLALRLISLLGRPISGAQVELAVSGCGNVLATLPPTDIEGRTQGTLASFAGERKTIVARTLSGGRLTEFAPLSAEFLAIPERTYFVRVSGSDAATGRSPLAAWATLGHALQAAEDGATIHVGAGLHTGPLELVRASAAGTFVLAGDPSGRMTGDAGAVVIEAGGAAHALRVRDSRDVLIMNLTLRGGAAGLAIRDSSDVRVLDCRAHDNQHGIEVEGSSAVALQDCRLTHNALAGARVAASAQLRFENNLVYANQGRGLVLGGGVVDALVRYDTFYRNTGAHLLEEAPGGSGSIHGNLFVEGSAEAFLLQDPSGYAEGVNLVWANLLPGSGREPPGTLEGDPLFLGPAGPDGILGGAGGEDDDFRLHSESPALERAGEPARAVLLASRESLATRTTRADDELDGSGVDQPEANLGYHGRPAQPVHVSVPKGGARLALAAPAGARLDVREWTRETPLSTRALGTPAWDGRVEFLEQRLSPLETREELWAAQVDSGAGTRLRVQRWDGRAFDPPALAPLVDGLAPEVPGEKRFDLEYEDVSGGALLVWADGDGIPSYRRLERGRWSAVQPVSDLAAGAGAVRWVELVPRAGTDELVLVTLDDARDLVARLWNGTTFGVPQVLEANALLRPSWRSFEAAFEGLSGDLLVSWGFSAFAEETRWAELVRTSGQWRFGQHASTEVVGAQIELAADPGSNRIIGAFGGGDVNTDVAVSVWTGTQWVDTAELALHVPPDSRVLEPFWFGEAGLAGVVFRRAGHTGSFNFAVLQPTGWRIQADVVLQGTRGSVAPAARVQLRPVPGQARLLGFVLDVEGRLFGLRHNLERFQVTDEGLPLASGFDPLASSRPFDVALLPAGATP
ncbi:MAG TPA: right-handed parallel beta-helix repeat-containing protein [Planctomycetota bacterium]